MIFLKKISNLDENHVIFKKFLCHLRGMIVESFDLAVLHTPTTVMRGVGSAGTVASIHPEIVIFQPFSSATQQMSVE